MRRQPPRQAPFMRPVRAGSAHLGLWRLHRKDRPPTPYWVLACTHDPKLVDELKKFPSRERGWIRDAKSWIFDLKHGDAVRELLKKFYWDDVICEICSTGMLCPELHRRSILAGATHITPLDLQEPAAAGAPAVLKTPKDRVQAAALLKVNVLANAAVVRSAARRMAFDYHPDRGGRGSDIVAIMVARDLLVRR